MAGEIANVKFITLNFTSSFFLLSSTAYRMMLQEDKEVRT